MKSNEQILIYNDSPIFGGHEIVTIEIANLLSKKHKVYFMFYNSEIGKRLDKEVIGIQIDISSKLPLSGLRSLNVFDVFKLKNIIKSMRVDLTIVSQGTIELSLKGALASKLLGIKTVSYIPLCFPSSQMGVKLGRIRDILNKQFYRLFDAFITISNEQKSLIGTWNKNAQIFILPNFVGWGNYSFNNFQPFSSRKKAVKIGVVGRILFKQKGQNKLIEIAKFLRKSGINFSIVVIGDGPDMSKLQSIIKKENLDKFFLFTGWIDSREKIYSMIDLLLITSNFEGVPLNMLEAILACKPVLAPCKGIFTEYLPESFIYKKLEDIPSCIHTFLNNPAQIMDTINNVKQKILYIHNRDNFEKKLLNLIADLV